MSARRGEEGSATAEFAIVVPAAVLLVALAAGTLMVPAAQVKLEHGAAQAARVVARGESQGRATDVARDVGGARGATVRTDGDLVCVDVSRPAPGPLPLGDLQATACALAGGW